MIFRFAKRRNWVLMLSSHARTVLGAPFIQHRGRYRLGRVREMEEPLNILCGSCRVLLHSPHTHIIHDYFPAAKTEILNMMLDDRIREEGFMAADAPFSHAFKVTASMRNRRQLLAVSLPSPLVERAFDMAEATKVRKLRGITSVPAALAALMAGIDDEPVITVTLGNNSCEFLVCHMGLPLMMQATPVDQASPDVPSLLLQGLKAVVQRMNRISSISLKNIVFLGHGVDYSIFIREGFHVLKPDLARLVDAENPADLLCYPEIAGALLAGSALDYMPRSWRTAYRIQDMTSCAAMAAGIAAIVMTASGFSMQRDVEKYRSHYTKQSVKVSRTAVRVRDMLPRSSETAVLERLMVLWKQNLQEPHIDDVLIKIAEALPPSVKIDHFQAVRETGTTSGDTAPPAPIPVPGVQRTPVSPDRAGESVSAPPAPMTYRMTMVTHGDFVAARTRFENTIKALKEVFLMKNVKWQYHEGNSQGTMNCTMAVAPAPETS